MMFRRLLNLDTEAGLTLIRLHVLASGYGLKLEPTLVSPANNANSQPLGLV